MRNVLMIVFGYLSTALYAGLPPSPEKQLQQLHDIQLPSPIGWWPFAPGWYGLLLMFGVVIFVATFFSCAYYLNGRNKRQALKLLLQYRQEHLEINNTQLTCSRLSELLKRVALVYFSREQIAALQGQAWIDFLTHSSKGLDFESVKQSLIELPYQHSKSSVRDLNQVFSTVEQWIKQRRGRCLN